MHVDFSVSLEKQVKNSARDSHCPEQSYMKTPFEEIEAQKDLLIKSLIHIAIIPSPTGKERRKILFIKSKLEAYGLKHVLIDSIGNCVVTLPSKTVPRKRKTILIVAHADTVCDVGEKVNIRKDAKYIYGHGVCDNSAGVNALLTTISLIKKYNSVFPHDLIFGFTVGEEGQGGKRGMKKLIKKYGKTVDAVINVESHNIGRVTNSTIGQYRSKLTIDTKLGGHSFRDFGRPNAIVILANIIGDFSRLKFSQGSGKTTYNVGSIIGEGSINAIAKHASCLFEIRSENNATLKKASKTWEKILTTYQTQSPGIALTNEIIADIPVVSFPTTHRLYKMVLDVQKRLKITSHIDSGNTDGDPALIAGIPTVTIGAARGYETHSLNEYMEKKSYPLGVRQAVEVIYEVATHL